MPLSAQKRESFEAVPLPTLNVSQEYDRTIHKATLTDSPNREEIVNDPFDHSDSDSGTDSSDEFDWDAEDDALSTRQILDDSHAKRGRLLWRFFMKLSRPVQTILVGAIGAGILIAPLLVFKLRFNSSPARRQAHAWSLWLTIAWAAGVATFLVVDLLPVLVLFILRIAGFKISRMVATVELVTAVSGWLKLALDMGWLWVSLSVIRSIYNPPGTYWTIVNRVVQALFSAGLLLLAEKVFLRYVAINFHRKALADRLAENQLGLEALDRLSNAQPAPSTKRNIYGIGKKGHKSTASSLDVLGFGGRNPGHNESRGGSSSSSSPVVVGEKGYHQHDEKRLTSSPVDHGKKIKISNAERRKRKKNAVAAVIVDGLGGAIGQVALKNSKFNQGEMGGSLASAGKIARKLFSALSDVHPARSHLIVEDFVPYFRSEGDARAAFSLFDKDGNGDITKREMREAVRRIYRERKALTASLKDVGSAVAKLDAVLFSVTLLIFIFICLLIFNRSNTIASLVPLATIILGFSFVFGHSAQTLFESLIFIFSTHVFDVGDLVMIDDSPMFVREFGLFSTTFRRVDGQTVIAPNALLASSKLVHNMRRSNSMWESTTLHVSYDTPLELIEQLRIRLQAYVAQNNREWSNVGVNIDKMEFQNAIHLIIAMEHRSNWQDWGGRWGRRTEFMRHLKTVLEDLDIRYMLPVQPVLIPKGQLHTAGGLLSPGPSPRSAVRLQQPPTPNKLRRRQSRESARGDGRYFHDQDRTLDGNAEWSGS